jgi:hypothetical protein
MKDLLSGGFIFDDGIGNDAGLDPPDLLRVVYDRTVTTELVHSSVIK